MADVFQVKAIKPNNLNVNTVRLELLNALRKEGTQSRKLLSQTTQYWEGDKPKFEQEIGLSGEDASLLVYPSGSKEAVNKWNRINNGTPRRTIVPRRKKFLRFPASYESGSKPNTLKVKKAKRSDNYVFAKKVDNPGIKARNWTVVAIKERYIPFRTAMNKALGKGLAKGGWK